MEWAQNGSLQAASQVNMKLVALHKQNQSDVIKIMATLHMGQWVRNRMRHDKMCIWVVYDWFCAK